ncbi:MAG: AraC family transcriptional regulator [Eubacteriales bacterium]|nr:AraC family transcriptional regulator [Eubacteriales bacterium]
MAGQSNQDRRKIREPEVQSGKERYLSEILWNGFHVGLYLMGDGGELMETEREADSGLREELRVLWRQGSGQRIREPEPAGQFERFLSETEGGRRQEGSGDAGAESQRGVVMTLEARPSIYFLCIRTGGEQERMLLLGPLGGERMTGVQEARWFRDCGESARGQWIPMFPLSAITALGSLAYAVLTGEHLKGADIVFMRTLPEEQTLERHRTGYTLVKMRSGQEPHIAYETEREYFRVIEEGDLETALGESGMQEGDVGRMALTGDFKQSEYMVVTAVTLMTRAAIAGGLSPQEAYDVSDLYLQRASIAQTVPELMVMIGEAYRQFTRLVHEEKQRQRQGALGEECRDYIAKHLYRPFTIEQMAREMAVSRSYLSRRFRKETGVTLQQYIRGERLRAAANLLKYSEEPIGNIAAYMQFPSAGLFGRYFRETYHMTPGAYRARYKVVEFTSRTSPSLSETGKSRQQ